MNINGQDSIKIDKMFCLNEKYSTTMIMSKQRPVIKDSPEANFETQLILSEGEGRKAEGGLRKRGYFKYSYYISNGQWFIRNYIGMNKYDLKEIKIIPSETALNLVEYIRAKREVGNQEIQEDGSENRIYSKEKVVKRFIFKCLARNDIKAELLDTISKINYSESINSTKYRSESMSSPLCGLELPLITIITVVLNDDKNIEKTIQSVINQNYPNVEYIIIDGGSSDRTLEKIRKYQHIIDYWISEKDNGIYHAMNKGIKLALGKYIGILNSGDNYTPGTLLTVFKIFYEKDIDFISGAIKVIDKTKSWCIYPCRTLNTKNILSTPFPHPACFVSSHLYKQIGLFDENLQISGDHDFMIRSIKQNIKVGISSKIFTHYPRIGKAYFTPYSLKFKEKEYIRKKNRLGLSFFILNLLWFFKKKIKKL
jgi:hypothetical protein